MKKNPSKLSSKIEKLSETIDGIQSCLETLTENIDCKPTIMLMEKGGKAIVSAFNDDTESSFTDEHFIDLVSAVGDGGGGSVSTHALKIWLKSLRAAADAIERDLGKLKGLPVDRHGYVHPPESFWEP